MPCPNCSHTLQNLVTERDNYDIVVRRVFWCPRCGTIRMEVFENGIGSANHTTDEAPKLVERCREFASNSEDDAYYSELHRLGILEAINIPENRPQ